MFSAQEDHYSGAALCAYRRLFLDKIATPKVFGDATAGGSVLGDNLSILRQTDI